MRKVFIACGGTGGHLAPGIALAEELVAERWDPLLFISKKQVDSRLVQKYPHFRYEQLAGIGLSVNPAKLARFVIQLFGATFYCVRKIKEEKPDAVIAFGGFLSMPVLLAACFCGVPTAIHEANRVAGRVTRLASFWVNRVYLPAGVQVRTSQKSRIRFMGMPVRREFLPKGRSKAKAQLGFDPAQKLLVVMGGSQGASALNQWVKDNLDALAQRDVQVLCLTGGGEKIDSSITVSSPQGSEVKVEFLRFSDDMATIISAADLVVSRAGAGSIAEIMRCRTPAILIPYPYAADNHQEANARYFERKGCGLMLSEDILGDLRDEVIDTIYNEWLLQKFHANLIAADRRNVQKVIVRDLETLAKAYSPAQDLNLEQKAQA